MLSQLMMLTVLLSVVIRHPLLSYEHKIRQVILHILYDHKDILYTNQYLLVLKICD